MLFRSAVDMDDSGPYEIAEPRVITALETYTPACTYPTSVPSTRANYITGLQTPRLKRLAEIVSAQAMAQQEKIENNTEDYSAAHDQDVDHQYDTEHEEPELPSHRVNGN